MIITFNEKQYTITAEQAQKAVELLNIIDAYCGSLDNNPSWVVDVRGEVDDFFKQITGEN